MKNQFKWLPATGMLFIASLQPALAKDGIWNVYQQALINDPQILASESGLRATEERVGQSMATLLPSIKASYEYSMGESEGTFDSRIPPSKRDVDSSTLSLGLTQVIYDHSIWKNLNVRKKQALRSGIDHEANKQNLIIRTSEAYFNVLASQDGLNFSKAEVEAISQELEQTKQRHEVGLIAITDVHEAQARYDQALADSIQAQNTLDNTIESLREMTNLYNNELRPLRTNFKLMPPSPNNIQDWIKEAEKNNLTLSARKVDKDIANETIKLNSAGHYPTLSLKGTYSDSDTDTTQLRDVDPDVNIIDLQEVTEPTFNESTSLALTLNVPIYSGGATHSKVKESQHLFQQSVHNMEQAYRAAIRQTRSAFLGIQASISSVRALQQSTISSQSALEATQAGFEVGTRTIVDVLTSTRTLFNAKRNLARAKYDYILNTLRLKQASGTLTEKDLRQVDTLLQQ